METLNINQTQLGAFAAWLQTKNLAPATREKYLREVRALAVWCGGRIGGETLASYKAHLAEKLTPAGVNGAVAAINAYLAFAGRDEWRLASVRLQKRVFAPEERALSKTEYEKLLSAAKTGGDTRLWLAMQTLCGAGLRVSELRFITMECLRTGRVNVLNKGKCRTVFLPEKLCRALQNYCRKQGITQGAIFRTRGGQPLDRSNLWASMKRLACAAGVAATKIFPHNLRHLFARTYYAIHRDIVKLADLLGHSSIDTTRIYTMETGETHRKQIQRLGLLRC